MPISVSEFRRTVNVGHESFADASDEAIAECHKALHTAINMKGFGADITDQDVATLAKNCQKLTRSTSDAGLSGQLQGLEQRMKAHVTASEQRTKADIDESEKRTKAHVTASEQRTKAHIDESEKRSTEHVDAKIAELKKEFSSALAHAGFNIVARLKNAAAATDVPLEKLKKEGGQNAGSVPPSPPFPADKAALFGTTTAEHIDALQNFYGVEFGAGAAEAGRASRTNTLQQRRQQLAAFLGAR